jgi:uncharacterized protein YjdB
MTLKQSRLTLLSVVLFLITLAAVSPLAAQDAITIGTVTATGNTVDVPVYVRDVAGTPLGRDKAAGHRIQSFSIKVSYSPAAAVQSVTFSKAGITAGLTGFENSPNPSGAISWLASFSESAEVVPFNLNAPPPGDQVAHLVFNLSASATPGSSIALTIDPSLTQLFNDAGTTGETPPDSLTLIDGAINIPLPTLTILPSNPSVAAGSTTTLLAQTSVNVASDTTVTLNSSNNGVATVPASVVIPGGARAAELTLTGVSAGTTTITATLPQSIGGASATADAFVTAACTIPSAPQLNGPVSAESGKTYAITWAAVSGANDYILDESTDQTFATQTSSQTLTAASASFTHATANRYYYRIRARNSASPCNTASPFSSNISVLVSVTPVAQTRYLPVVGSTPGNNGAYFKTAVQLFNPKSVTITGKIVFHTQAVSGAASDPSLVYAIGAGKAVLYPDLLPAMGVASGLGSADIVADAGSAFPVSLVRVFNDGGAAGTTGLALEQMAASDALQSGETAALIAPSDAQRFRLNIGVRSLDQGVAMTLTVRDKFGSVVKSTTKSYGPNFFVQPGSAAMLDGYALVGEETISIAITSGSAFVYGSTTDNTTQDPSVQFAKRIE